ncbi:MAG TPA: bifunctional lysylphosphatidylglycerol flippase/synthetase MprF [Myxococcota bacterium]|nr:bifunctional lysylphosphatidylglycerol flippase/synthetase MprF [Myxococcota bacterium]
MRERALAALGPLLGLALFALAAWVLHHELAAYHYRDVIGHLRAIPSRDLALALALTALGYLSLTGYDALALRFVGSALDYPRVALASFVAYVFSHNVGLSFLGGSAIRYRMFTSWGVTPGQLGAAIAFNVLTFWLGFLALSGLVLALDPIPLPASWTTPIATTRPLGVLFLCLVGAWCLASALGRRRTLRLRGFELQLPGPGTTAAQIALSAVDWTLAGAALYALLPEAPGLDLPRALGVFLLAQVAGLASHVPAGLGVFETALVVLLRPWLPGDAVLGSALAYRLIYYLLPMAVALPLFAAFEARARSGALRRAGSRLGAWLPELVPRALAATTFAAGVLLLLSGATPAAPGRFEILDRLLPLPVMELSHLLASVLGVALLVLARSVQQRIDAAYGLTLALLCAGAAASLLKGLDYEEAAILLAMAAALLPCRRYFYRRSALLSQSFSPAWIAGIAAIFVGVVFVLLLAHRDVAYSHQLWWQFAAEGHAPRSLRALAAGAVALGGYGLARLLRPAAPLAAPPTAEELDRAEKLVAAAPSAEAHLALLGDKRLLFHESGAGLLMYGVQRRSFVAMGDAIGPRDVRRELAWRFRELADQHGGVAAFYEVSADDLPIYLDLGLVPRKLGEEARVPLAGFSLEGSARKALRHVQRRVTREGARFELVPREGVPALLPELRAVSDAWLAHKSTREKRFSLGFFEPDYLRRCPLAVVRRGERVVAFANVWAPENREECSLDLMRYAEDAPSSSMDFLFVELMLWARDRGYRWFGLGMAPLSGFEHHRLAPLWNRVGALLFRHGEHFYNFRGLRSWKEKFDPVWEPRYLASPGGLTLPFVLTDVAALISGGVTGVVTR